MHKPEELKRYVRVVVATNTVDDDRGAGLLTCAGCERHKATANRRGICPLVLAAPALLSHMPTRRDDMRASACEEMFTSQ
jgi:hypothetical protein